MLACGDGYCQLPLVKQVGSRAFHKYTRGRIEWTVKTEEYVGGRFFSSKITPVYHALHYQP